MSEKSLKMRHFQAFAHLEEPGVAPSWAAGVARDEKIRQTTPMESVGCTIVLRQAAKKEILDE